MFADRYQRNLGTITPEENDRLKDFQVCVIGCGGLGGYIIEELARLGIGHIIAVDGDVFQPSNLNRQIFSTEALIGKSKAQAAKERVRQINSEIEVQAVACFLTEENAQEIITEDCHAVIDALDNISCRRLLEAHCSKKKLPLIHGAIAGWHGQVGVIMPGDSLFDRLYPEGVEKGAERETGNPSFTPAVIASLEVAETLKVLLGKPGILRNRLLAIDLMEQEYDMIEL